MGIVGITARLPRDEVVNDGVGLLKLLALGLVGEGEQALQVFAVRISVIVITQIAPS